MKTIEYNLQASVMNFGSQMVIEIPIDITITASLYSLLSILKEDISDTIQIKLENFNFYLKKTSLNHSLCSLCDIKAKVFKGDVSNNTLDYLSIFLLKYFNDGISEAQHIDLDFRNGSEEVTITISAKNYFMHSPDKINKLLTD